MNSVEVNTGEIKINFKNHNKSKISLEALGLKQEDCEMSNGLLRLVVEFGPMQDGHFVAVPTIEISYKEEMSETHWQCDYNNETILDKYDHHGHSTVILLKRTKLEELTNRHENSLVVHAEFPSAVHINPTSSFVTFF